LILLLPLAAWAQVQTVKPPIPLNAQQEARYRALLPELRCLVCQNESLADSQAPLAADLRYEIRGLIAHGEDDAGVRKYLTDRYGDFVLYRPPLARRTVLVWFGPFLLLGLGLVLLLGYARRSRRVVVAPASVDQEALRKLLDDQP
jgi:cytochrome c-type biogenesis protein CcmH